MVQELKGTFRGDIGGSIKTATEAVLDGQKWFFISRLFVGDFKTNHNASICVGALRVLKRHFSPMADQRKSGII